MREISSLASESGDIFSKSAGLILVPFQPYQIQHSLAPKLIWLHDIVIWVPAKWSAKMILITAEPLEFFRVDVIIYMAVPSALFRQFFLDFRISSPRRS